MPTGDPYCWVHGFTRCSCGEAAVVIALDDVPPPPDPAGTLSARHRIALTFGWPLVHAIESNEVEFMFVADAMRLRRSEIDSAIKKTVPVFTEVTEMLARLSEIESALTKLGETWLEHHESWWVRLVELMLEEDHPAKRGLRSVLNLAVQTAQKNRR